MSLNNNQQLENILSKRRQIQAHKQVGHTQLFMSIIFIIGIILTLISWDIDAKIQKLNCPSSSLKTSNKIVLCVGVTFIASSLSFYLCSNKCGSVIRGFNYMVYIISMLLLGVVLIILGAIITSESSKPECSNTGHYSSIWGLGTIIVILCLLFLYMRYRDNKLLL
jgi:hypothetical protein